MCRRKKATERGNLRPARKSPLVAILRMENGVQYAQINVGSGEWQEQDDSEAEDLARWKFIRGSFNFFRCFWHDLVSNREREVKTKTNNLEMASDFM